MIILNRLLQSGIEYKDKRSGRLFRCKSYHAIQNYLVYFAKWYTMDKNVINLENIISCL